MSKSSLRAQYFTPNLVYRMCTIGGCYAALVLNIWLSFTS